MFPTNEPDESQWRAYGIRFFAWVGAIALFLAGVFASLPAATIVAGIALLVLCRSLPERFRITANAVGGAGGGVLFAAAYVLFHSGKIAIVAAFLAMAAITAIVAYLAIQRHSLFLAFLSLIGAFAIPALLGLGEAPLPLFGFLLLLNAGVARVAHREDWPLLTAFAVPLTVVYEWAWVIQNMTVSDLKLAAVAFALLAAAGSAPLWYPASPRDSAWMRGAAALAALLPLLFALYVATEPNYSQHFNVLFGFLLVVAAGLAAIVLRRGGGWLHAAGGIAVLLTFFLWFAFWLYTLNADDLFPPAPQQGLVLGVTIWIALFVALYLARPTIFAGLLFFAFVGLAMRQPQDGAVMMTGMFLIFAAVLVVCIVRRTALYAGIAAVFALLAVIALHPSDAVAPLFPFHAMVAGPPLAVIVAAEWILLAGLLAVAWRGSLPWLAIVAAAIYAIMIATTGAVVATLLLFILFVAYAFIAGTSSNAPYVALLLAGVILLATAWSGVVALLIAAVMFALLLYWWVASKPLPEVLFAIVASSALAFLNAGIALLLPATWTAVLWSLETALLSALAARFVSRPTLRVWSVGLAAVVFAWITLDTRLYSWIVFTVCGVAMYAAAWFARSARLRLFFSLTGLTEHWLLINILIAQYYRSTGVALNTSFGFAPPLQDATYTVAWAVVAMLLMILGVLLPWRGARVGAASLLILASIKCFGHDVEQLTGRYQIASLVAVALTFIAVSAILQKSAARRPAVAM